MSNDTKVCYQGHILANYHRKDGRCGGCHELRQKRYRATSKGHQIQLDRESRRRRNPERIYYRVKWALKASINAKRQKIAELERTLQ